MAVIAAVADGREKPSQRPIVVTSYGRGRRKASISGTPTSCSTTVAPRNVKRWRHRFQTIVVTNRASMTTDIVQPVAIRSMPRATVVSQPARTLGDAAQHCGVDLVGEATGPRRQQGDHQPGHEQHRRRDPAAPRAPDLAGQRRRGTGWAAPATLRPGRTAGPRPMGAVPPVAAGAVTVTSVLMTTLLTATP